MLEPYEGKLSRTVLRGEGGSNTADLLDKPASIMQREGRAIRQGNENKEVAIYRYVTKSTFDAYSWAIVENKQRFISQIMTNKAVSRSCEDVDEATLNYAEIKAVATGNPLIKEKMEIDNEVQRLKLLKSTYDTQRYTLQDNFMIKYPKLIKACEQRLQSIKEDIKYRDSELLKNPKFSITIGNMTFSERADGGKAVLRRVSMCRSGEITEIGKFHGFKLLVKKNFIHESNLILRGRTEYEIKMSTSPAGNMVKLENKLKDMEKSKEELQKNIEQHKKDMQTSKAEYEKPFAYDEELKEKLKRQNELNMELKLENAKEISEEKQPEEIRIDVKDKEHLKEKCI